MSKRERLKVLTREEISEFEAFPKFKKQNRRDLFWLSSPIRKLISNSRGPAKAQFLVRVVYFKAEGRFFNEISPKDFKFACALLGIELHDTKLNKLSSITLKSQKDSILNFFCIKTFDFEARKMVEEEMLQLFRLQRRPRDIFYYLVDYLKDQKIEVPSAKELIKLISNGSIKHEKSTLDNSDQISSFKKLLVKRILREKVRAEEKNQPGLIYNISKMKGINQSQSLKGIKEVIAQYLGLQKYFNSFDSVLDNYQLDNEGFRRLAIEFVKSDISKIRRLKEERRILLVTCFIRHQYYLVCDHLTDIFLNITQSYQRKVKSEYKESVFETHKESNKSVLEIIDVLEDDFFVIGEIQKIVNRHDLHDSDKVTEIKKCLKGKIHGRKKRFEKVQEIREEIYREDHLYTELLLAKSHYLKRRVGKIVSLLPLVAENQQGQAVLFALDHFKKSKSKEFNRVPVGFLSANQEIQLKFSDDPHALWCIQLFLSLSEAIKSGQINVKYSYKYKSLEDYLIPLNEWNFNIDTYIKQCGIEGFKNPTEVLEKAKNELSEFFELINESANNYEIPYLSFRPNGKFRVSTPATEYSTENYLYKYFPRSRYIPLSEILSTVNGACGFLDKIEHFKFKAVKGRPNTETFVAGIIGNGCNIGLHKMAKISKNVNESGLSYAINWYFSKENLDKANDCVVNYMNGLSLPLLLRFDESKLHTSSDGQRWTVSADQVLSRSSYRFFGKNKGISVNSHIDERHFAFHSKVISTSDREAASVLDGLLHNENIISQVHSTDTHGYTEALFGLMEILGFKFAPRIKGIRNQRIYDFKKRSIYKARGYKILPSGRIDEKKIITNWDEILRFVATIKLKRSSASQLFKRLNSYSRKHPLYQALKEFGKIYKTQFILEYISDIELRQKIEKQLNKVEESNRLNRAICFGNNQELLGGDVEAIEVGDGCRRLIKNSIICWNYMYLSNKIIREKNHARKKQLLWAIKNSSILHWQHMNFHGEYDFSKFSIRDSEGLKIDAIPRYDLSKMWKRLERSPH